MKSTKNGHAALARETDLIVKELPDEVLVYDLKQDKAHCLNGTAAFVWHHCDGKRTASEIAELMQKEWQTPVSEDAVWFTLNRLSKADLLQERITVPPSKEGISRRSAVRRLGFGALLAVPVVMSIVTPAAAAAASVPAVCLSCVKKSTSTTCPSQCATIGGTCFGNSGCGAGQACDCRTCASCFAGQCSCHSPGNDCVSGGTTSWVTPGTLNCPH